jgi:hypothetical protein
MRQILKYLREFNGAGSDPFDFGAGNPAGPIAVNIGETF